MIQEVIIEPGGLSLLSDALVKRGISNVFVITGKHFNTGLPFQDVHHYIKQTVNVELGEGDDAFDLYKKTGATAIVALGGGSVIDLAKTVVYRCIENELKIPFLVAAPTTAGSGSEATQFAVVYNEKKKLSLQHHQLLPALILLDVTLTLSLSPAQTAISGIDAFAQAVESFWNVHATEESRGYSREAIILLKQYLPVAVENPEIEIRKKVLWAAHLAGKAINITRTTGPHALSYYLTSYYGVPHGQSVALFLPVFFLYNERNDELYDLLDAADGTEAFGIVRQLMKRIGLATTLAELNINIEDICDALLNEVNEERFKNNPAVFDKHRLAEMCKQFL